MRPYQIQYPKFLQMKKFNIPCEYNLRGHCKFGDRCRYLHTENIRINYSQPMVKVDNWSFSNPILCMTIYGKLFDYDSDIRNFYTKDFIYLYQEFYTGEIPECIGLAQVNTIYNQEQLCGATGGNFGDVLKLKHKYRDVIYKYWLIYQINVIPDICRLLIANFSDILGFQVDPIICHQEISRQDIYKFV